MKHLKTYIRFNENTTSVVEIEYNESYMFKCMSFINFIPNNN
jgi:hypothetical protein